MMIPRTPYEKGDHHLAWNQATARVWACQIAMTHRHISPAQPQPPIAVAHHKAAEEEDDKARQPEENECEIFGRLHGNPLCHRLGMQCCRNSLSHGSACPVIPWLVS